MCRRNLRRGHRRRPQNAKVKVILAIVLELGNSNQRVVVVAYTHTQTHMHMFNHTYNTYPTHIYKCAAAAAVITATSVCVIVFIAFRFCAFSFGLFWFSPAIIVRFQMYSYCEQSFPAKLFSERLCMAKSATQKIIRNFMFCTKQNNISDPDLEFYMSIHTQA